MDEGGGYAYCQHDALYVCGIDIRDRISRVA